MTHAPQQQFSLAQALPKTYQSRSQQVGSGELVHLERWVDGARGLGRCSNEESATVTSTELAFTLVELLVITLVVLMVAAMGSAAVSRPKAAANSIGCLNNKRQLVLAWRMYAQDNNDVLPFGISFVASNSAYNWVQGSLSAVDPTWRENWDVDSTIRKGVIWPYCGNAVSIFHCPADSSFGIDPQGQRIPRRSVSMSNWVGGNGDSPQDGYKGGWSLSSPAIVVRKLSQFKSPGPANTFVFLDEHQASINDGEFVTQMDGYPDPNSATIIDLPASYHMGGAGFGFADGHGEVHKWRDRRTTPPVPQFSFRTPNNADVLWLQTHAADIP